MQKFSASQIYLFITFMMSLAASTIFTTYSIYYVMELRLNPLQLVLIGTVLEVTVLIFEGITGVVADTYSRKLSVIIGMFVLGCAFVLEGSIVWIMGLAPVLPAFGWMLISQMLYGIGWTFFSGSDTAWIVDELEEGQTGQLFMRSKMFGLSASLLGIGVSVGLSVLAPNLPFLAGGAIYFLLGLILFRYMRETGFTRRERAPHSSPLRELGKTWASGASILKRHPLLLLLTVVTLFSGAASEGYDRLWPIYLMNDIGFPAGTVSMATVFGAISAGTALLGMLAVHWAGKMLDLQKEQTAAAALFLLTLARAGCMLLLALSANFYAAVGAVLLLGVIGSVSEPVYTTWLNTKLPSRNRATLLSMISQTDALGQSAGGPAVGYIGNRFSLRASLLSAVLLLLPVIALYGKVLRKSR